jgi:hypothetical protein
VAITNFALYYRVNKKVWDEGFDEYHKAFHRFEELKNETDVTEMWISVEDNSPLIYWNKEMGT